MVWLKPALKVAQLDYQPVHAEEYSEQHADYGKPGGRMEMLVEIIAEQRAAKNRGEEFRADRRETPETDGGFRFGRYASWGQVYTGRCRRSERGEGFVSGGDSGVDIGIGMGE